jgi:hypothetical protein
VSRRRARLAVVAVIGQALVVGAMVLLFPLVACPDDTVIPVGQLCPAGHQYEPLRMAGPTWVGLCYDGKDGKAAVARACATRACDNEGLRTLDESVKEGNHIGGSSCAPGDVSCTLWDIYIFHEIWRH